MNNLPTRLALPEGWLAQAAVQEVRDLAAEAEPQASPDQTAAFVMADAKHSDLLMALACTRILCALTAPPEVPPPPYLIVPGVAVATCLRRRFRAAGWLPETAVEVAALAAAGAVSPDEMDAALRRAAAHLPSEDAHGLAGRFRAVLGDDLCYAALAGAALVRRNVAVLPELRSPAGGLDELAARLYRDAVGKPSATLH